MMVVRYAVEGDMFRADRSQLWSEGRFSVSPPITFAPPTLDLHPDGERFAVAPLPDAQPAAAARQDKLVFVFNFFDELRRLAPATKP